MESVGPPLLWGGFTLFVLALLALDLGFLHRKAHVAGFKEALAWSVVWVALAPRSSVSASVSDGRVRACH
jgi:tellurite resistance protein TerC